MIYFVIENNVVVNRIITDENTDILDNWVLYDKQLHARVNIGYYFNGETFTAPPINLELEAAKARQRRNVLLTQSDVFVLPDRWINMTTEQQQSWSKYRQALRDIPDQQEFPQNIIWPQKP